MSALIHHPPGQPRGLLDGEVYARHIAGGGQVAKLQLHYTAATDLADNAPIAAATWSSLTPALGFTVDEAGGLVVIAVRGACVGPGAAAMANIGSRVLLDEGAGPALLLGGSAPGAGVYDNFFAGGGPVVVRGLARGSHSLRVQLYSTQAGAVFCRAATKPDFEGLTVDVVEHKR